MSENPFGDTPMNIPGKKPEQKPQSQRQNHFMATVQAIYVKEEQSRQRMLNIHMATPRNRIVKADLASIQQAAIQRLVQENQIEIQDVKDIIFLAMVPLGAMTEEEFHGASAPVQGSDAAN